MNRQNIEIWRPIDGYKGNYLISNHGNVKCLRNGLISPIKPRIDRAGYLTVRLTKNGETNTRYIHRLVAAAYVPNHMNKPFINHRNGNKLDNSLKNLEWVTHAENIKHAYDIKLIPKYNEKKVVDDCSGKKYSSIKDASNDLSIKYSTLRGFLNGRYKNKTCLKYLE
jgi:hypothetical protein